MDLLSPKVDFIFKHIFGTEDNKDVLISFLNAVFEDADQPLIQTVTLLNPILDKTAALDKMAVLDIEAQTETGTLVNVEIQLWDHHDMEKRTLYYWARLFVRQLAAGEHYRQLHKTITINIVDFDYLATPRYHTTFHVVEDHETLTLTDLLEIHFVELRKLREHAIGIRQHLVQWMLFLSVPTSERWEDLAMQEPSLKKAMTTLEFLSQDAETRRLYDARQKAIHDYVSDLAGAKEEGWQAGREEGRQEGREEGRQEERRALAKSLLRMGLSLEQITQATGLSLDALEKLQADG